MTSGITVSKNNVGFGGLSLEKLLRNYQTPVFLFSEQRVIDNYQSFIKSFKKHYPNTQVYYSIKTNSEPQILKTLKSQGSKGEIASELELLFALKGGFKPEDIILDGPAWTDQDIKSLISKGISTFNIDSIDLLNRVNSHAKKLNKKINVSFRIYPEQKMSILKSFIEHHIAKFGIPLSQALDAYKIAQQSSHLIPTAISTHIGSMITDPKYYEVTIDKLVDLADDLKRKLNINIKQINLGGGFGIQSLNYYSLQNVILNKAGISQYSKAASIEEFGQRIAGRFKQKIEQTGLGKITLVLEPGRFIVSDAGVLVTKVVSVKNNWIFIDGGINLIPESIFFIRRGFMVANKVGQSVSHKYNIAGPTLNTADVLAIDQRLPKIEVGDTIIVLDAGAYSLTRSNQFTIMRPDALYITKSKQVKYLRKKEHPKELLDKMLT